jgi:hypothetical protein
MRIGPRVRLRPRACGNEPQAAADAWRSRRRHLPASRGPLEVRQSLARLHVHVPTADYLDASVPALTKVTARTTPLSRPTGPDRYRPGDIAARRASGRSAPRLAWRADCAHERASHLAQVRDYVGARSWRRSRLRARAADPRATPKCTCLASPASKPVISRGVRITAQQRRTLRPGVRTSATTSEPAACPGSLRRRKPPKARRRRRPAPARRDSGAGLQRGGQRSPAETEPGGCWRRTGTRRRVDGAGGARGQGRIRLETAYRAALAISRGDAVTVTTGRRADAARTRRGIAGRAGASAAGLRVPDWRQSGTALFDLIAR